MIILLILFSLKCDCDINFISPLYIPWIPQIFQAQQQNPKILDLSKPVFPDGLLRHEAQPVTCWRIVPRRGDPDKAAVHLRAQDGPRLQDRG